MEYFGNKIDKYFAKWILSETWNSVNPDDQQRFHQFCAALVHYNSNLSESVLRCVIFLAILRNHCDFDEERGEQLAGDYASRIVAILEHTWALKGVYVPNSDIESCETALK